MSYGKKSLLAVLALTAMSFSKGWIGLFFIFVGIPFVIVVLGLMFWLGRKNPVLLQRRQILLILLSLSTVFVVPSLADTSDSMAFMVLQTTEGSAVYNVAGVIALVGVVSTLLYGVTVVYILVSAKFRQRVI